MFDIDGNLVQTLVDANLEKGEHIATFIPGNIPAGVYICVLREGDSVEARKIVYKK